MPLRILQNKKNAPIPLLKKGQYNSYRPEDIKQWGVGRFLDTVCAKNDIEVPILGFNDEENKNMDVILYECL